MGGAHKSSSSAKSVSQDELDRTGVAYMYRDSCAHLLLPLNACRKKNYWLPFRCVDERHAYEECEYKDYVRRMSEKVKQRQNE